MIIHPIPPLFDKNSEILILGSFPSVKSRQEAFFYAHPQNRFWKVVSAVFDEEPPVTVEEKKELLYKNRIALWDVIASCDITGSSDSSIKNVKANSIAPIIEKTNIKKIFVNGKTAFKYYNKYIKGTVDVEAVCLPSTSAANAAFSQKELIREWTRLKNVRC